MNKTNKQKLVSCKFRHHCLKSCFDCIDCDDWEHDKQIKIKSIIDEVQNENIKSR